MCVLVNTAFKTSTETASVVLIRHRIRWSEITDGFIDGIVAELCHLSLIPYMFRSFIVLILLMDEKKLLK